MNTIPETHSLLFGEHSGCLLLPRHSYSLNSILSRGGFCDHEKSLLSSWTEHCALGFCPGQPVPSSQPWK